ncbi:hypothetical protein WOLCODRAFT_159494 [Wolfiporia cocos MD-104 SS10]|uniref:Uncharacterized protein n=1 Tax=Wolfiporia cocos (strain MD-104) TaxID=742152 RepID=A0A2H3J3I9_WOLCO|nr:hypothetical protein WOLCODRAFT_159494 [Wolfiporia cocos MD-104 SS10]
MQARGDPAPPRAPSLQSTAHGSAACLTNRALGLDDPQLHPAPRAFPPGRTNAWGIASAPAPVVWATVQALGAHGGTIRLNNWDLWRCSGLTTKHPRSSVDPRGNPARAPIERGAASAAPDEDEQDAKAPDGHRTPESKRAPRRTTPAATRPFRSMVAHQRKAIRQGQPPESNRHSRKPQPPTPQRIKRKGGQRHIVAKATRRAPSRTAAPPLYQTRHPFRRPRPHAHKAGRAVRQAARQRVGRGAEHTNTPLGPATWSYHTPTASHSNRATAAL